MENVDTVTLRVIQFIDRIGIADAKMARKLGISPPNVAAWRAGKSKISSKSIIILLENFQNLNSEWLLNGEGNMLKPTEKSINEVNEEQAHYEILAVLEKSIKEKDEQINKLIDIINKQLGK